MFSLRAIAILTTVAGVAAGCARYTQAAGEVIDPVEAARTVVLHVENMNSAPMELRAIESGRSEFIGSVGGHDSTSILLDPALFPTGTLYVAAIPADARGRAIVGPLAAGKGDKIRFTVQPDLRTSDAIVVR